MAKFTKTELEVMRKLTSYLAYESSDFDDDADRWFENIMFTLMEGMDEETEVDGVMRIANEYGYKVEWANHITFGFYKD